MNVTVCVGAVREPPKCREQTKRQYRGQHGNECEVEWDKIGGGY